MSLQRSIAATLCIVLSVSSAVAQEEAEAQPVVDAEVAIDFGQGREQVLTNAVSREMKLASRIAGLSEAQVTAIISGLKEAISKHAKPKPGLATPTVVLGMGDLDDRLGDQVLKAVKAAAKDKRRAVDYEEDVMLRRKFKREASIAAFIQSLDSRVGLGLDQTDALNKVAEKLYETGKLPQDAVFGIVIPGEKPQKYDELNAVLTKNQQRFYQELGTTQPFGQTVVFGPDGQPDRDEEKERAALLKQLRLVAEMKLDYLDRLLKLSEKQKKKLTLVSKGVMKSAVDQKMAATKAFADYQESMMAGAAGGAFEPPDPEMMSKAMAQPVEVFSAQPRWAKFVKSTLTAAQRSQLDEIEKKKRERTSNVMCSTLVMAFGSEIQLSGQQKLDMRDLLKKHVRLPPGSDGGLMSLNRVETFRGLLAIKDTDWIGAMGDENWEKFRPQLGQLRQQLDRADKPDGEQ